MADNDSSRRTARDAMAASDWVAHPDHPLTEAARRLQLSGLKLLPVSDGDELVGVVLAPDVEGADPRGRARVRDVMAGTIPYCFEDETLDDIRRSRGETAGTAGTAGTALCVLDRDRRLVGVLDLDAASQGGVENEAASLKSEHSSGPHSVRRGGRAVDDRGAPKGYSVAPRLRRRSPAADLSADIPAAPEEPGAAGSAAEPPLSTHRRGVGSSRADDDDGGAR